MNRAKAASLTVVVLALLVGAGVMWNRHNSRVLTQVITHPATELGPHAHVLLPDLDKATVVVPDRPHDPSEVRCTERFSKIKHRRHFEVSTNSLGLRGVEIPEDGKTRILCLGDSVTFGWGVKEDETYPARLAQELNVNVINAGVPAMKPSSIAAWAAQSGAQLKPDLVLFTRRPDWGTPNPYQDFQNAVRKVVQSVPDARVAVVMPPVSTFDPMGAKQHAEEYKRVRQMLGGTPVLDLTEAFRKALPQPGYIMTLQKGLQRMQDAETGAVLVEAAAPSHGLATAIVDAFESDNSVREPLFFDGGHPDAEGFELFAREVADWIKAQGLLQTQSPPSQPAQHGPPG